MKSFRGYVTENGMHNGKNGGGMGAQDHAEKENGGGMGETFQQKYTNETGDDVKITAERLTKQIAAAYRGQSNKNVLADIISSAEKGKRDGTLTNEEIDAFYRQFSPMLNFVQRKKLAQIIEQIKRI